VFEKSLRLRGLERFYKGMGTGHIHKGTGTVPLPDSRYGCGSRTLRFPHPDCRPALYQLRRQSSQLPPSYRFPPLREGNHKGSVPPASRGNLMEGVRNSPLLEHLQPCPHKPLPFRRESIPRAHESIPCGRESTHCGRESMHCERESTHCGRESMHCGRESTHCGRISHTLSVNGSGCHTGCLGRPVRHASPVR
jgi:hypothetical protein